MLRPDPDWCWSHWYEETWSDLGRAANWFCLADCPVANRQHKQNTGKQVGYEI